MPNLQVKILIQRLKKTSCLQHNNTHIHTNQCLYCLINLGFKFLTIYYVLVDTFPLHSQNLSMQKWAQ